MPLPRGRNGLDEKLTNLALYHFLGSCSPRWSCADWELAAVQLELKSTNGARRKGLTIDGDLFQALNKFQAITMRLLVCGDDEGGNSLTASEPGGSPNSCRRSEVESEGFVLSSQALNACSRAALAAVDLLRGPLDEGAFLLEQTRKGNQQAVPEIETMMTLSYDLVMPLLAGPDGFLTCLVRVLARPRVADLRTRLRWHDSAARFLGGLLCLVAAACELEADLADGSDDDGDGGDDDGSCSDKGKPGGLRSAALVQKLLAALKESRVLDHLCRGLMLHVRDACAVPSSSPTQIAPSSSHPSSASPSGAGPALDLLAAAAGNLGGGAVSSSSALGSGSGPRPSRPAVMAEAAACSSSTSRSRSSTAASVSASCGTEDLRTAFGNTLRFVLKALRDHAALNEVAVRRDIIPYSSSFGTYGFSTQYLMASHALSQIVAAERYLEETGAQQQSKGGGGSAARRPSGSTGSAGGQGAGSSSSSNAEGGSAGSGGAGDNGSRVGAGLYGLDPALLPPPVLIGCGGCGRPDCKAEVKHLMREPLSIVIRIWARALRHQAPSNEGQLISRRAKYTLCMRMAAVATESLRVLHGVRPPPWLRGPEAADSATPAAAASTRGASERGAATGPSTAAPPAPAPSRERPLTQKQLRQMQQQQARQAKQAQQQPQQQQQRAKGRGSAKPAVASAPAEATSGFTFQAESCTVLASDALIGAASAWVFRPPGAQPALAAAAAAAADEETPDLPACRPGPGSAGQEPCGPGAGASSTSGGAAAAEAAAGCCAGEASETDSEDDGVPGCRLTGAVRMPPDWWEAVVRTLWAAAHDSRGMTMDLGGSSIWELLRWALNPDTTTEVDLYGDFDTDDDTESDAADSSDDEGPSDAFPGPASAAADGGGGGSADTNRLSCGSDSEFYDALSSTSSSSTSSSSSSLRARFLDANMPVALPLGLVPCLEALVRRAIPEVLREAKGIHVWSALCDWVTLEPVLLRADPRQALAMVVSIGKAMTHLPACLGRTDVADAAVSGIVLWLAPLRFCTDLEATLEHPPKTPGDADVAAEIARCLAALGCGSAVAGSAGTAAGSGSTGASSTGRQEGPGPCTASRVDPRVVADGVIMSAEHQPAGGACSSAGRPGTAEGQPSSHQTTLHLIASVCYTRWLPVISQVLMTLREPDASKGIVSTRDRSHNRAVMLAGAKMSTAFRLLWWAQVVCRAYQLAIERGDVAAAAEWRQLLLGDVDVFGLLDMAVELTLRGFARDTVKRTIAEVAQTLSLLFPAEMAAASAPRSSRFLGASGGASRARRGAQQQHLRGLRDALRAALQQQGSKASPVQLHVLETLWKIGSLPPDSAEVRAAVLGVLTRLNYFTVPAVVLVAPSALSTVLPVCANPRCANLAGDSEAELPLPVSCGGCGGAVRYCSKECRAAHARAGHSKEVCAAHSKEAAGRAQAGAVGQAG